MLLVADTIRKFGYDPTKVAPTSSLHHVVRKCDGCGGESVTTRQCADRLCKPCAQKKMWERHRQEAITDPSKAFWIRSKGQTKRLACQCGTVEEAAGLTRTLCLGCSKTEAVRIIAGLKSSTPRSVLLVEETIQRFGYDPTGLAPSTKVEVVRKCGGCAEYQVTRLDSFYKLCTSCGPRLDWEVRVKAYSQLGLTPTGRDASSLREKSNAWRRGFDANRRVSEVGRLRGILYATLGLLLKGKIVKTRNLPYTSVELQGHIKLTLESFAGRCPMCRVDLSVSGYDVDHKIPTSAAKTVQEMQASFELSNLSVLCPDCNRRVKKAKPVVYDEIRSIKGGSAVALRAPGTVN